MLKKDTQMGGKGWLKRGRSEGYDIHHVMIDVHGRGALTPNMRNIDNMIFVLSQEQDPINVDLVKRFESPTVGDR